MTWIQRFAESATMILRLASTASVEALRSGTVNLWRNIPSRSKIYKRKEKACISNPLALLKDKCNHSKNADSGKFYNYADIQILVFKGWFPLLRNFSVRTHLKFTRVNEIEAIYERPRVNEELSDVQLLPLRVTFHTLPLFYLRVSGHLP